MTILFKWFLRTGTIPAVPIVRDNLGDIASSDNYRTIAIGSLLLKWFNWLIIILEGDKLATDELQFGFQAKSGTSMCTWAINTVIDHYNRLGRPIFACLVDLCKAFDMVSWAKLFSKLFKRKISPLILRCLIHIYSYQMCNSEMGEHYLSTFQCEKWCTPGCSFLAHIVLCLYKWSD